MRKRSFQKSLVVCLCASHVTSPICQQAARNRNNVQFPGKSRLFPQFLRKTGKRSSFIICAVFQLQGWLNTRSAQERDLIFTMFDESFPLIYRYATQDLLFKMDVLEAFVIRQACDLLQGLIPAKDDKDQQGITKVHMERLYVFTLMWSIGALLELDDRAKLEEFMRKSEDMPKLNLPELTDSDSTMFDYFVDADGECRIEILKRRKLENSNQSQSSHRRVFCS